VTSAQVEGLTVKVASVRTWRDFDGTTPAQKGDERWVSGVMKLQTDPTLGSSRLASGERQMSSGADGYKAQIRSFAAKDAPRPSGRFCEVIILISNPGPAPVTVEMLEAKTIAAHLLPATGTPFDPRAFLIPGLAAADTSLVESFEGKLAVTLAPGEQTWMLLLFDVPVGQANARLQIKKASLSVTLQ
jgi:hypothetical protein